VSTVGESFDCVSKSHFEKNTQTCTPDMEWYVLKSFQLLVVKTEIVETEMIYREFTAPH
jgi:hypothetical protein